MRISVLAAGLAAMAIAVPAIGWPARELGYSIRSGWTAPAGVIYSDSAAFRRGWSELYPAASMRPRLPKVDFTRERVLIVAVGSRPSGGYTVRFDSAHANPDSAVLFVSLRTPPPGCGVTQEITSPAVAIGIPTTPSRFSIITRERPDGVRCTGHT